MAEAPRSYDVWLVASNSAYREVPFTVVSDWVQQRRLLETDQVKPTGTKAWRTIAEEPLFAPYLPRAEPFRTEDQAEALEPVELELGRKRPVDEDDDPDMIPLIDISMVLLVFFMMAAGELITSSMAGTPEARNAQKVEARGAISVSMTRSADGSLRYFLDDNMEQPFSEADALRGFADRLRAKGATVRVIIKAHGSLPASVVRHLTVKLEDLASRQNKQLRLDAGVSGAPGAGGESK